MSDTKHTKRDIHDFPYIEFTVRAYRIWPPPKEFNGETIAFFSVFPCSVYNEKEEQKLGSLAGTHDGGYEIHWYGPPHESDNSYVFHISPNDVWQAFTETVECNKSIIEA